MYAHLAPMDAIAKFRPQMHRKELEWLEAEGIRLAPLIITTPDPLPKWVVLPEKQRNLHELLEHLFDDNPYPAMHLAYHFGEISALIKFIKNA